MSKGGSRKPMVGPPGVRPKLVALWTADPSLSVEQVFARSGAPKSVCLKVRRDLVASDFFKRTVKK